MKRRAFIATLVAGAALAGGQGISRIPRLCFDDAIKIARHEIERHGLAATHHVSALYAGMDKNTEGAAFAVILRLRADAPAALKRAGMPKLKLLIQEDGCTMLRLIENRVSRRLESQDVEDEPSRQIDTRFIWPRIFHLFYQPPRGAIAEASA